MVLHETTYRKGAIERGYANRTLHLSKLSALELNIILDLMREVVKAFKFAPRETTRASLLAKIEAIEAFKAMSAVDRLANEEGGSAR